MRGLAPAGSDHGTILAAMSGGVDSAVTAARLLEAGNRVIGASMWLWTESEQAGAGTPAGIERARAVAQQLGIPFHVLDARQRFRLHVVDYLIAEYARGRTPNPCLACNRQLKFGWLLEEASRLGADGLATGHYVRTVQQNGRWRLLRGKDRRKDQSYVLYMLGQRELAHTRFPLGDLTKDEVRAFAGRLNLTVAEQPESQEICFVADNDYRRFLRQHAPASLQPGPILDQAGQEIGRHAGIAGFTIGQRKGLGIAAPEPLYVLRLDAARNAVIVGPASAWGRTTAWAEDISFVAGDAPTAPFTAQVKIRYQATLAEAQVIPGPAGRATLRFVQPQRDITPGQGVVFYAGDEVLGGGILTELEAEPDSGTPGEEQSPCFNCRP